MKMRFNNGMTFTQALQYLWVKRWVEKVRTLRFYSKDMYKAFQEIYMEKFSCPICREKIRTLIEHPNCFAKVHGSAK